MAQYNYSAGVSSVGQYQMSGRPFMTGGQVIGTGPNNGEVMVDFPNVTKSLTVVNRGDTTLMVHFDTRANANVITNHHYMSLPNQDDSYGFDIRSTRVYISQLESSGVGLYELHAELTSIDSFEMHSLSGSGINN